MNDTKNNNTTNARRNFLQHSVAGLAGGVAAAAAGGFVKPQEAYAQAARDSLLRKVLNRGHLIVGTGSTTPPWHYEDENGVLTGMDVDMGRILALGLFQDADKIEFVRQAPDARIPNIITNKVDVVIQFMTVSPERAQVVAFSRPYWLEGISMLTRKDGRFKTYEELAAGGSDVRVSILQNVYAEQFVHNALPQAQVLMLDQQANVIQALAAGRADAAMIGLSQVGWAVSNNPDRYLASGYSDRPQYFSAAVRQDDPDWLHFIDTVFNIAMFGHEYKKYAEPYKKYFGEYPPVPQAGMPSF